LQLWKLAYFQLIGPTLTLWKHLDLEKKEVHVVEEAYYLLSRQYCFDQPSVSSFNGTKKKFFHLLSALQSENAFLQYLIVDLVTKEEEKKGDMESLPPLAP